MTDEAMNDEYEFAAIGETDSANKFVIPVPISWKDVVNDLVWGELWKNAIKAELIFNEFNDNDTKLKFVLD